MSGHSVSWKFSPIYGPSATFTCHEPEGANCRLHSNCECESWNVRHDKDGKPYHVYLTYDDQDEEVDVRHDMFTDECGVITWLEEDEAADTYAGPERSPADGPIVVEWQDPGYSWSYANKATL